MGNDRVSHFIELPILKIHQGLQMREKLAYWTVQLRNERNLRRHARHSAPHKVPYHRQREQVIAETISMLRDAMADSSPIQGATTHRHRDNNQ